MIDVDRLLIESQTAIFSCGLLLPADQEVCAIEMFHVIDQQNDGICKFQLNKVTHPPYVRLYETVIPLDAVDIATDRLRELSEETQPFQMQWGETERTQHFVAIWGETNPALQTFHDHVIQALSPLRAGHFKEKYIEDRDEHLFSSEEEASFEKWGSPWVDPYVPHMIIAKAHSPKIFDLSKEIPEWDYKHTAFRGLLVGLRTEHGDFSQTFQLNFGSPSN